MHLLSFVDPENQTAFDRDGFVIIPLLTQEEVEELSLIYEATGKNTENRNFHSTMFINDSEYRKNTDAAIRSVIYPKVTSLLKNFRLLFSNFIVKENSVDTRVDIHQDWNFTTPDFLSINIWIPLTDIDTQTGLFHILKGSHHSFRNIRYTPHPNNAYATLENFIRTNSTACALKAGYAIVYHGAAVHFSDANISAKKRLAIGAVFIQEGAPAVHYYKRDSNNNVLELYATNESFYNHFNFETEPTGVSKIGEISSYNDLPSEEDLIAGDDYATDICK